MAVADNQEELVDVRSFVSGISAAYEQFEMVPYVGQELYVRKEVAKRLALAQEELFKKYGYTLKVVYGYRHPEVQALYFARRRSALKEKNPALGDEELDEQTHAFVAVPAVAGHPTGGAVDLTIIDKEGNPLDMGTTIADFSDPLRIQTAASGLTPEQRSNRWLLCRVMRKAGFAPFYGEWWHFSYGDREWAWFYKKSVSLYSPVDFRAISK